MGESRGGTVHRSFANDFGAANDGHWVHGWRNGRYGWWWRDGLGWTYYRYPYEEYYSEYGLPSAAPNWYCSDPPGYYPYITECNTAWQTAPGS